MGETHCFRGHVYEVRVEGGGPKKEMNVDRGREASGQLGQHISMYEVVTKQSAISAWRSQNGGPLDDTLMTKEQEVPP